MDEIDRIRNIDTWLQQRDYLQKAEWTVKVVYQTPIVIKVKFKKGLTKNQFLRLKKELKWNRLDHIQIKARIRTSSASTKPKKKS